MESTPGDTPAGHLLSGFAIQSQGDIQKRIEADQLLFRQAAAERLRLGPELAKISTPDDNRFPSLLAIKPFPADRSIARQALLDHFGFGDVKFFSWYADSEDVNDGYEKPGKALGTVTCGKDSAGRMRTLVTFVDSDDEHAAIMQIGLIAHELGHVADIQRRINFKEGQDLDLIATEFYAHWFACREMKRTRLAVPLCAYIGLIRLDLDGSQGRCRKLAAEKVFAMPAFPSMLAFTKPYARFFDQQR